MQSIQKSFTVPKHVNQQHKAAVPHEGTDKALLYSLMYCRNKKNMIF